jgi:integrase/recombinase XerD
MDDNYTHLDNRGQIIAILRANGIKITEEELNKPASKVTRRCPRCKAVNTGGARFCMRCGSSLRIEDYVKAENERSKVVEALRSSTLVSDDIKYALDNSLEMVLKFYLRSR